ncbi:nitroreductase family protein [Clostridium cylindrosporum]|uniref:nitroreductase family protein n=1 Tax=Clostridium cylindrosporum TaxID=1495 RepID=UPI00065C9743|nr:nitroreductase family protein [Clostridium cylindrosporum]
MCRDVKYNVLDEIQRRWSPRAFSNEKVNIDDIYGVLEAARLAPSCYNEQPWRYIIAFEEEDLKVMRDLIDKSNRVWADNAPVLIAFLSKRRFKHNTRENYWHMFDVGASWGYLTIEAQSRGLITRGIGGFNMTRARRVLNVPYNYDIVTLVAMGKQGDVNILPEDLRVKEVPSERMDLSEILHIGKFRKGEE